MTQEEFEAVLDECCEALTQEAQRKAFTSSEQFEQRVREVIDENVSPKGVKIDFSPKAQAFPDIAVGDFGVEVKFTLNDTWRSVANSVLETQRVENVRKIYIVFGKMGGEPGVRWEEYEKCVIHVRTSHVPRFEVELFVEKSLFDLMGVPYDVFRNLPMREKMRHIRKYAKGRLKKGESLWWLDDEDPEAHSLPMQARLYRSLPESEKRQLRAESVLLFPEVLKSGRSCRDKYDNVALYLLTQHGVLCHQVRDMFTAGSVTKDTGKIEVGLQLIKDDIHRAAKEMNDALFVEYWGESVKPEDRLKRWGEKADQFAKGWKPSKCLL
ncbi:MAG: restriction endonuclease [Kiritimatiellia bacterium]|jgi:hypothetical protein